MEDASALTALAARIREARKAARLSQDELADLAGLSRRPIYLLESGRGAIRLDSLIKILDALGLKLEVRPQGPRETAPEPHSVRPPTDARFLAEREKMHFKALPGWLQLFVDS